MTNVTHVAVAILQQPDGKYLLASRPQGKPWAGWWEFPGGKIEANETPELALVRELKEELGITATRIRPWLQRVYDYPQTHDSPAKTVHLHFYFVTEWQGELHPHEGQQLSWQTPSNLTVQPILPANTPIMKALALPEVYAISNVQEMGEKAFMNALEALCNKGCRLVQIREKHMNLADLQRLTKQVLALTKSYGVKVLLNADLKLARALGLDGVHLPSAGLMQLGEKPEGLMVAASCHNDDELAHAQKLDLDFVTLSPVLNTQSHPDALLLGWQRFAELLQGVEIPVYALGGMQPQHLESAWAAGARGIAMQRAVWK